MSSPCTHCCPRSSALLGLLALAACQPDAARSAAREPRPARIVRVAAAPVAPGPGEGEPASSGEVLALLDGIPVHADEIRPRVGLRLYRIEADRHALLRRELDALIDERLLAREAARRGVTVEALLAAGTQVAPVTGADVDAYLAEHPRDAARGPEIRPRIAAFLAGRRAIEQRLALARRLRARADIDIRLRAPERPRTEVDITGAPARGHPGAPVTIVHFASFTSAASARMADLVQQLADAHPGRIRWVHRHFLGAYDEVGLRAAELSVAAQDAGRFWELHDLLFARGGALTRDSLSEIAARLGLDRAPARASARVQEHIRAGVTAGVERLPVVFVNGRHFSGTFPPDRLRAMVAEELRAAGAPAGAPAGTRDGE